MRMGMVMELTGPGVQDRPDAYLRTNKAFLGGRLHEQTIERCLMA
jgi:hypothetical protein